MNKEIKIRASDGRPLGSPTHAGKYTERYILRVTPQQRAAWRQAAILEDRPMSQWIRWNLDREAAKILFGESGPR